MIRPSGPAIPSAAIRPARSPGPRPFTAAPVTWCAWRKGEFSSRTSQSARSVAVRKRRRARPSSQCWGGIPATMAVMSRQRQIWCIRTPQTPATCPPACRGIGQRQALHHRGQGDQGAVDATRLGAHQFRRRRVALLWHDGRAGGQVVRWEWRNRTSASSTTISSAERDRWPAAVEAAARLFRAKSRSDTASGLLAASGGRSPAPAPSCGGRWEGRPGQGGGRSGVLVHAGAGVGRKRPASRPNIST